MPSATDILTLSTEDVDLEYLAEGAANIVYRINPPSALDGQQAADLHSLPERDSTSTPPPSDMDPLQLSPSFTGRLVRLRKTTSTVPVVSTQSHFELMIQPLFPTENLVQATLFRPSNSLLRYCNSQLRVNEKRGIRPAKRQGTYLAEDEPHGVLVTDMSISSSLSSSYSLFEFKPKWLVQSPSAPAGSRRCRTCALRAMKAANRDSEKSSSKATFCPINLVSHNRSRVMVAVDEIMGPPLSDNDRMLRKQLLDFLYRDKLLERLRELQLELDPEGVFKADLTGARFLAAMTLRDCTLFLKVINFPFVQPLITTEGQA